MVISASASNDLLSPFSTTANPLLCRDGFLAGLKLSRVPDVVCGTRDKVTVRYDGPES